MSYKPITVLEPAKDLPLKWYEAHPVIGSKVLSINVEVEDERTLHLLITGNTWLFRDELERHGNTCIYIGPLYLGVLCIYIKALYISCPYI